MKIYTETIKISDKESFVGVLLVGDHNRIYYSDALRLQGSTKGSTIMAVRRVFSFKKNMKPLYCNETPIIFSNEITKEDFQNDEFLNRFSIKEIKPVKKAIQEVNLGFLKQLHTLTTVSYRQYYLLDKLYREGKLNGKN